MKTKNYLSQNSKMKKMTGVKTFNWGIPAFISDTGMRTCPNAGICAKGCYAKQGTYVWSNVAQAFEKRLALSLTSDFVPTINAELKRRKVDRLRIHDSGDFYSLEYLNKWLEIIHDNPSIQFYAYTKMVDMFKNVKETIDKLYPKFTIIYSFGGKQDNMINTTIDRHSQVFENIDDLIAAGYIDASKDDANAISTNHKVGLIYHGAKSKKWLTG